MKLCSGRAFLLVMPAAERASPVVNSYILMENQGVFYG